MINDILSLIPDETRITFFLGISVVMVPFFCWIFGRGLLALYAERQFRKTGGKSGTQLSDL
jgi:hypothetical protein